MRLGSNDQDRLTTSPFQNADVDDAEVHPVDQEVERRLPQRELRARIRRAEAQMSAALGDQVGLWLELEELLNQRRIEREEAYYNIGYEHGLAAGKAEVLRTLGISVQGLEPHVHKGD